MKNWGQHPNFHSLFFERLRFYTSFNKQEPYLQKICFPIVKTCGLLQIQLDVAVSGLK